MNEEKKSQINLGHTRAVSKPAQTNGRRKNDGEPC